MCQQEKEQMLELPPLMTNKQIHTTHAHTHTYSQKSSRNGHISSLFPTRQARRKGIFSGCGWWHAIGGESGGAHSPSSCWCLCGRLLSQLLESALFSITCVSVNKTSCTLMWLGCLNQCHGLSASDLWRVRLQESGKKSPDKLPPRFQ